MSEIGAMPFYLPNILVRANAYSCASAMLRLNGNVPLVALQPPSLALKPTKSSSTVCGSGKGIWAQNRALVEP